MSAFQKPQLGAVKAKILLVGSFGSGKTYGGLTFPRPAVIDSEGSADLYARKPDGGGFDFEWFPTKSLKEAMQGIDEVMRGNVQVGGKPCETLVIDSLSSFYDTVQFAMMRKDGAIDMQGWGLIKRQYAEFIDTLYHKLNVHVVATARVKPKFTGTDAKSGELLSDGEVIDCDKKVGYAFDLVFKLSVDNGKRTAKVMKTRGIFSEAFPEGRVIDGGFSWSLVQPILDQYKAGTQRQTGATSEEAAGKDASMMNGDDHTTQLRAAYEALIALKPHLDKKQAAEEIVNAIRGQFPEVKEGAKLASLTPAHLKWVADYFSEQKK